MNTLSESVCMSRERTLQTPTDLIDGTVIQCRAPIFALTTAFTCALTACLLSWRGAWLGSATFMSVSALMSLWQIRIAYDVPTLVVQGPVVILYRRGITDSSLVLSELSITEGSLGIVVALIVLALAGSVLGALGLSCDLQTSLPLYLSPTQRLFLGMSGVWLAGSGVSLCYLDFPRRKVLLRSGSKRPRAIYFDNRNQRNQLRISLRALKLEEVMLRVGLVRETGSHHDDGDGTPR
jgi:hypothetical protein